MPSYMCACVHARTHATCNTTPTQALCVHANVYRQPMHMMAACNALSCTMHTMQHVTKLAFILATLCMQGYARPVQAPGCTAKSEQQRNQDKCAGMKVNAKMFSVHPIRVIDQNLLHPHLYKKGFMVGKTLALQPGQVLHVSHACDCVSSLAQTQLDPPGTLATKLAFTAQALV